MQIKFLKISQIVNKTGDNNTKTNHQEYCAFFSQASERAGILNRWIWLANHALVTGPAGPRAGFFPAQRCT